MQVTIFHFKANDFQSHLRYMYSYRGRISHLSGKFTFAFLQWETVYQVFLWSLPLMGVWLGKWNGHTPPWTNSLWDWGYSCGVILLPEFLWFCTCAFCMSGSWLFCLHTLQRSMDLITSILLVPCHTSLSSNLGNAYIIQVVHLQKYTWAVFIFYFFISILICYIS